MMFLRAIAFTFLCIQTSVAPPASANSPLLVVKATANVSNDVTAALNVRDLEHYVVAELFRRRVATVVPSSSAEDLATSDAPDAYLLELSIEQLEEAWRPRWNWNERRYVDDDMLHLELSLALTRIEDGKTVGGLYDIRDYRAEDFGSFSSPQAVRAVVYRQASNLTDAFVSAASEGEFGESLRYIQRPATPADLVREWNELSSDWKIVSVFAAVFLFMLLLGVATRILWVISRLTYCVLVPASLREPPPYPPPAAPRFRPRRQLEPDSNLDSPSDENNADLDAEGAK